MHMLKRFYNDLLPVYTSQGKLFVSCKYCVSLDNGRKQNCLKCKVNVIHYTCYLYDDRKLICPFRNDKMKMLSVLEDFNKQEKQIFDRENKVSYGFSANELRKHIGVFPSVKS